MSTVGSPLSASALLQGASATDAFAAALAPDLVAGDTLLLDGPVGAGKTAFARGLLHSLMARAKQPTEDVPSPTFTLVQTYQVGGLEVWHADLYRVSGPDEVLELGLADAFETALCLIEWPDRLGTDTPDHAITLRFAHADAQARTLGIAGTGRLASAAHAALASASAPP
ncbi:MAG: tRNA (adenosine(37)-N6)-threonylcarbamoyltransferase complex ATPase subunit type 1 TsaE [Pseudomonadota bacterium]